MDTIESKFESLSLAGIDDEWIELHKWVRNIRNEKQISISCFLESCGLASDNHYFRQLVSKELGICRRPSSRSGTPGKFLRDTLTWIKCDPSTLLIVKSVSNSTLSDAISDWRMDNLITLRRLGIRDVSAVDKTITIKKLDQPLITPEELWFHS
jgi:hypothetical protein